MIIELPPGLPLDTYPVVDLPASAQTISLDSLPLGEAADLSFPSTITWESGADVTWESGEDIEWENNTSVTPQSVPLKG